MEKKDLELGALPLSVSAGIFEGHLERGFCSEQLPAINVFMASNKNDLKELFSHACFAAAGHHTFLWRPYINVA